MISKKVIDFAFLNKHEHCASVEMIIDGFAFREASVKDRKIEIKSTAMWNGKKELLSIINIFQIKTMWFATSFSTLMSKGLIRDTFTPV